MAHVVIKVARNAGIVALFIVAAMLGVLSGVLFAYAGDLPHVSALDDYTPSTITRISASSGQVIGEFATQRRVVIGYDDINPLLRQAIIATEDAEFDRHFGVNIWRMLVAAAIDIAERRRAQGASTLTQQLARNLKEQFGLTNEKSFERKIREIDPRDSDREAVHEARDLHHLLQSDVPRARRLRRRGGVAHVLQQVEQAAVARGGGADCRHLPDARAPEPVRRHRSARRSRRNVVLQRMADEHFITQAAGRRGQAEAGRHPRPAEPAARHRAVLRRGSPQAPRAPVRRQGALRERPLGAHDARRDDAGSGQPGDRARAAARRQTPRLSEAEAQRPRRAPHDRGVQGRAVDPSDRTSATSFPPSSSPRRRPAPARIRDRALSGGPGAKRATRGRAAPHRRICSSRAISSRSRSPSWTTPPARRR